MWLTGVGWPSRSESIFLNLFSSSKGINPASAHVAYSTGAAWPYIPETKMTVQLGLLMVVHCKNKIEMYWLVQLQGCKL